VFEGGNLNMVGSYLAMDNKIVVTGSCFPGFEGVGTPGIEGDASNT